MTAPGMLFVFDPNDAFGSRTLSIHDPSYRHHGGDVVHAAEMNSVFGPEF